MPQFLVFLLYVGSLGAAAAMSHSFFVLGVGDLLLLGGVAIGPLVVLGLVFKNSERLAVAAAHVLVAIALHPGITLRETHVLVKNEQVELLRNASATTKDGMWWIPADAAKALATSLATDAKMRLKYSSPWMYWLFPPSVVLCIWAGILYWLLPPGGGATALKRTNAPP